MSTVDPLPGPRPSQVLLTAVLFIHMATRGQVRRTSGGLEYLPRYLGIYIQAKDRPVSMISYV